MRLSPVIAAGMLLCSLASCIGFGNPIESDVISISVRPGIDTIAVGQTKTYAATVQVKGNVTHAVFWSVEPSGLADIKSDSTTVTLTGRFPGILTLTAVSQIASGMRGTATIVVRSAP